MALLSALPPWNQTMHGQPDPLLQDQALQFWPWRLFLWSELRAGRLPGWNPLNAAGVPFAGLVSAAPFFPLEWLGALTGPLAFSLLAAFVKIFTAGFGAALHTLQLGGSRSGAALAGVTFALCGFMVAWLGHPHTNVACLLPWLFVAIHRATEDQSRRTWALFAVVVGLILLGGHPPTELFVLFAGAAYALARSPGRLKATLLYGSLGALAGAALAAPALLPFFEYYAQSSATAASALLARSASRLSPWELLFVFVPRAADVSPAFRLGFESNFLERAAFVGLPSLALAAFAWRRSRFHFLLAIFGFAAALGLPPLPWIFKALPLLSSANPTRFLLFFCFGVSVLAGLAVGQSRRAALLFGAAAIAALTTCAAMQVPGLVILAGAAEASVAAALIVLPGLRPLAPVAAAAALLYAGQGVNQTAPVDWLYPTTPEIEALRAEQGEGRILAFGPALAPDTGLPLGLRDVRGRDFMTVRRYEELLTGRAGVFAFYGRADVLPKATGLLALSAIAGPYAPRAWRHVSGGALDVFRAPEKPHRALFVPAAIGLTSAEALVRAQSRGFDPRKVVLFDDGGPAPSGTATGTAGITGESTNQISIEAESNGAGWLVLLDTWYPGWNVEVNGEPAELRRADYAFRAVALPKGGKSSIRFDYRPRSRTAGLWLALLAAAAILAAIIA